MKIIIIGAGPIGILSAIKFGLLNHDIIIYDKRNINQRTREQIVVLEPSGLRELPKSVSDSNFFRYTHPIDINQSGGIDFSSHAGDKCIQLKYLEKILLLEAFKFKNIHFIYNNLDVKNIHKIIEDNNNALILGCDGFNSTVREALNIKTNEIKIGYGIVGLFKNENSNQRNIKDIKKKTGVNINNIMGFPQ
ncbi:unnamed protein product, partial [marine sediment metagenome]